MDQQESKRDRQDASDSLSKLRDDIGGASANDQQDTSDADGDNAAYDLHIANELWKAVGRKVTAERVTAFFTFGILCVTAAYTHFASRQADAAINRTLIPPTRDFVFGTVPMDWLGSGEWTQISTDHKVLWVGITLHYDNGFGGIEKPGFCYTYTAKTRKWNRCSTVNASDLK